MCLTSVVLPKGLFVNFNCMFRFCSSKIQWSMISLSIIYCLQDCNVPYAEMGASTLTIAVLVYC